MRNCFGVIGRNIVGLEKSSRFAHLVNGQRQTVLRPW